MMLLVRPSVEKQWIMYFWPPTLKLVFNASNNRNLIFLETSSYWTLIITEVNEAFVEQVHTILLLRNGSWKHLLSTCWFLPSYLLLKLYLVFTFLCIFSNALSEYFIQRRDRSWLWFLNMLYLYKLLQNVIIETLNLFSI